MFDLSMELPGWNNHLNHSCRRDVKGNHCIATLIADKQDIAITHHARGMIHANRLIGSHLLSRDGIKGEDSAEFLLLRTHKDHRFLRLLPWVVEADGVLDRDGVQ